MVFPISDDNIDRIRVPFVNYTFIAINVFVLIFLQTFGHNLEFINRYSVIPEEIASGTDVETPPRRIRPPHSTVAYDVPGVQPTPIPVYLTLFTAMFMHGDLWHLLGNMLFLWIFGDNVENILGHVRYLFFYLVCGFVGSLAHVVATYALDQDPTIPSLGASGAISGVLGGYVVLHPMRRVTVFLFRLLVDVPAVVVVGLWFLFQIVNGLITFARPPQAGGGIAYGAHIGGFVAGLGIIQLYALIHGKAGARRKGLFPW